MLIPVPSPSSRFCAAEIVDHSEFQRSSTWCMPIYDSEVDQVRSIPVLLKFVVPVIQGSSMPFSTFRPCARRRLGDEYASACTFSSSLLRPENPLRLMAILPPGASNSHSVTHRRNTVFSTDTASYPQVPSAMIDDNPLPLYPDLLLLLLPFLLLFLRSWPALGHHHGYGIDPSGFGHVGVANQARQ
jgi:hypothetical protein